MRSCLRISPSQAADLSPSVPHRFMPGGISTVIQYCLGRGWGFRREPPTVASGLVRMNG